MIKSLENRVAALKIEEPLKVEVVHVYDSASGTWQVFNTKNRDDGTYTICAKWDANQLSEWVFITVCEMTDDDASIDDDDDTDIDDEMFLTTGTFDKEAWRVGKHILLEEFSDRGHKSLTVFELA